MNHLRSALFLIAFTCAAARAQIVPTKIEGSFSVTSWVLATSNGNIPGQSNPFLPVISGAFSYTLDLPTTGDFFADSVQLDTLTLVPSQFGTTTFTLQNVGLSVWFLDGHITTLILGGRQDGVTSFSSSGGVTSSDFLMQIIPDSPFTNSLFFYQIDGIGPPLFYFGENFAWSLSATPLPVSAVPEPATYGIWAGFLCLVSILVRRRLS